MTWRVPIDPPLITSPFGWRVHPISKSRKFHKGVDFDAKIGQKVYAPESGIIKVVGYQADGAGKYVKIQHDNNLESLYFHLDSIDVKQGRLISKGDVIGRAGTTGRSTGAHLHFEVRRNGEAINPLQFYPGVKFPISHGLKNELGIDYIIGEARRGLGLILLGIAIFLTITYYKDKK